MRIARLRPTGLRSFWGALDASQRRTPVMMVVVVGALHVIGFVTLFALVAPSHYHLGASGSFTIGIGIAAYTIVFALVLLISIGVRSLDGAAKNGNCTK
jgi:hypothetical protein